MFYFNSVYLIAICFIFSDLFPCLSVIVSPGIEMNELRPGVTQLQAQCRGYLARKRLVKLKVPFSNEINNNFSFFLLIVCLFIGSRCCHPLHSTQRAQTARCPRLALVAPYGPFVSSTQRASH